MDQEMLRTVKQTTEMVRQVEEQIRKARSIGGWRQNAEAQKAVDDLCIVMTNLLTIARDQGRDSGHGGHAIPVYGVRDGVMLNQSTLVPVQPPTATLDCPRCGRPVTVTVTLT